VVLIVVVSLATLCLSVAPARADLFGFTPITHNSDGSVAQQLSLEVSAGGGVASFTFYNNLAPGLVVSPAVPSSITLAYFDNRTVPTLLTGLTGIVEPAGVSFAQVLSGTLPGGNSLLDEFAFSFGAEATSAGGKANNGVHPGEYVTLTFSTPTTVSLADIVAALNAGAGNVPDATDTLRIGIHVQGIGTAGYSDAFVLTPTSQAPIPGAYLLGMLGLGAAGLKLRQFA
jgi:hypothetical protein